MYTTSAGYHNFERCLSALTLTVMFRTSMRNRAARRDVGPRQLGQVLIDIMGLDQRLGAPR